MNSILAPLRRWAALIQLACLEANSRGGRRFQGVARARRTGFTVSLWAIAPMIAVAVLEALGLRRGALWRGLEGLAIGWAVFLLMFMMLALARALFRAARLRLAMDRAGLAKYPRYPRTPRPA